MKITELERISGVHRSTIHHYLNVGLLPRPRVRGPKLHVFDSEHVARLAEIRELRARGWSLAQVREQLEPTTRRARPKRSKLSSGEHADHTRRRIIERATHLFAERGYDGVRLSDVARALGVGKATIYRYFSSKQALFVDCVEHVRFTLIPKTARETAERETPLSEQGRLRARAVLEHFDSYRALTHFLGALAHGSDASVARRAKSELHGMITNAEPYLKKLIAMRAARRCDAELLAYMLWGALIGAGERLTLDASYSLEQVLDAYLEFAALAMGMAPPMS